MRHPFQAIPSEKFCRVLIPLILITLISMIMMNWISSPLNNPDVPNGIISFELAGTTEAINRILASWDNEAQLTASLSLGLDYLFLVIYSTAIGVGCIWASGAFTLRGSLLASIGVLLAWGQWLAALLDGVENAALIRLILGDIQSPWPQVARICAIIKFSLIALGLMYVILGASVRLIRRTSQGS